MYKQQERSQPREVTSDFKPKININAQRMKRTDKISDILYTDAIRRRKSSELYSRKVYSSLQIHEKINTKSYLSSKTRSKARKESNLFEINRSNILSLNI